MTKQRDLKRRVRERMAKTGESYTAARRHLVGPPAGPDRMAHALHLSNGDATDLAGTGLARQIVFWRDVLHEGPVPAVGAAELRRVRADFLARADAAEHAEALRTLTERDRAVEDSRDGDYVLWFEADLYDQLQIIQILARLAELDVAGDRITLICIGEHPGFARFGGLGQLSAEQLRRLPDTDAAARLTPAALQLATSAWAAFRAKTPAGLGAIAATRSPELRFLGEAFDRLSREYPSTRDGLSLTERRVLAAVADGARDAGTAFVRAAAREVRPYLGDTWCYAVLDRLANGPAPLVTAEPGGRPVDRHTRVQLTVAGERVLAGQLDQVRLNGIDRWIGGVHLTGAHTRWRWDEGTETLTDGGAS